MNRCVEMRMKGSLNLLLCVWRTLAMRFQVGRYLFLFSSDNFISISPSFSQMWSLYCQRLSSTLQGSFFLLLHHFDPNLFYVFYPKSAKIKSNVQTNHPHIDKIFALPAKDLFDYRPTGRPGLSGEEARALQVRPHLTLLRGTATSWLQEHWN